MNDLQLKVGHIIADLVNDMPDQFTRATLAGLLRDIADQLDNPKSPQQKARPCLRLVASN